MIIIVIHGINSSVNKKRALIMATLHSNLIHALTIIFTI